METKIRQRTKKRRSRTRRKGYGVDYRLDKLIRSVYTLFASIIIIKGEWRHGKTDFALLLSHDLAKIEYGFIKHIASNILTAKDPKTGKRPVTYVDNFPDLKRWSNKRGMKLFIYDEVIEANPSRSAMSKPNVEWLRFLPQISKKDMHIIAIAQTEKLIDKIFKLPIFWRGTIKKKKFRNRAGVQHVISINAPRFNLYDEEVFNIPRTSVSFDTKKTATFSIHQTGLDMKDLPRTYKVAVMVASGDRYKEIMNVLGLKQKNQITREVKKALKHYVALLHGSNIADLKPIYDALIESEEIEQST